MNASFFCPLMGQISGLVRDFVAIGNLMLHGVGPVVPMYVYVCVATNISSVVFFVD
jgi:hypothetical protein